MIIGQQPEATVPEPPEDFNGAVASGVMAHSSGRRHANSFSQPWAALLKANAMRDANAGHWT
jgi:hypothetical protein